MRREHAWIVFGIVLGIGLVAALVWRAKSNRIQAFQGVVDTDIVTIPEEPDTGIRLITPGGFYELKIRSLPRWRQIGRQYHGKEVVVRGILQSRTVRPGITIQCIEVVGISPVPEAAGPKDSLNAITPQSIVKR